MARRRNCPEPNCIKVADGRYCPEHNREHDKARGSKQQRGYGKEFQATRRWWKPRVEVGIVDCWRCKQLIQPGSEWHLGHDDNDRSVIKGPEHSGCNLRAAGQSSASYR